MLLCLCETPCPAKKINCHILALGGIRNNHYNKLKDTNVVNKLPCGGPQCSTRERKANRGTSSSKDRSTSSSTGR